MKNNRINVLVFPCGSEIGLEIHRSLKYSNHINLFGANSTDDHGKFVYENYISNLPFFSDEDFFEKLKKIIQEYKIDAIYPTMDSVIKVVSEYEKELECKVIGSPKETNKICSSKLLTYKCLEGFINLPEMYNSPKEVISFPIFMKPDVGYGSRGAKLVKNHLELQEHLKEYPTSLLLEYLPGKEYTVDCFTNKNGELLYSRARERARISKGISVKTKPVNDRNIEFEKIAKTINSKLTFRGAWFFQVKEDVRGELCLLEVASRLAGSSSIFRNTGVNFALLSIFDKLDYNVKLFDNNFEIVLDRALSNKYKININFNKAYIDFDDCLILRDSTVNIELLSLIFKFINKGVRVILITKHERDINNSLTSFRLQGIFDEIIHLSKYDNKYKYMDKNNSIFIDDSFAEREEVYNNLRIPVFAPDAIESLI
uniref:ATP-grasp domain-containing protein n=1 Tax=uncultured Tenacibaculum sp. TaxID=174713 RepID=UPI00261FB7ED|nr:ATP-grasp domain-containing protein [uncultured Tenacibaculum sp.]